MADETKNQPKPEVNLKLGLGGLFKGFGDLIDMVGDLIEKGEQEAARSGEFKVEGLGDKVRGVYGFSVRTDIGGAPRVERFGNIRKTTTGPVVAETREPLVDTFDEGDEILVTAEMPGVDETEIRVEVVDDILRIETTGSRRYAREVLLPAPVDPSALQQTYRNGILELRLHRSQ